MAKNKQFTQYEFTYEETPVIVSAWFSKSVGGELFKDPDPEHGDHRLSGEWWAQDFVKNVFKLVRLFKQLKSFSNLRIFQKIFYSALAKWDDSPGHILDVFMSRRKLRLCCATTSYR